MMSQQKERHASLSFSDRFSKIVEISKLLEQAGLDSTNARDFGKGIETEAFSTAASLEEYDSLCNSKALNVKESLDKVENDATMVADASPASDADGQPSENLGVYKDARHHEDGLFSTIYKAKDPAGGVVALKATHPQTMAPPHNSRREARILKSAASRHIISLLESFSLAGDRFVLVFPFLPYDLASLLSGRRLRILEARSLLRDMFSGLAFLHEHGIIHRDVKPSNLLAASPGGPAYLSDFGIAWSKDDPESEAADAKITDVGTTSYRPPELLFGKSSYDSSLDMWAAGCVVAETVCSRNQTLFDSGPLGSELALVKSIFESLGTPSTETWPEATSLPDWGKMDFHEFAAKSWETLLPDAPAVARDLVDQLVRFESSSRLTATHALSHPFFIE